jgi:Domain of unknown function (DUF6980)
VSTHCCADMEWHLAQTCTTHPDRFDCPDQVIDHLPDLNEYGLIIHDGGSSHYVIRYCPWCGCRLPKSKREDPSQPDPESLR